MTLNQNLNEVKVRKRTINREGANLVKMNKKLFVENAKAQTGTNHATVLSKHTQKVFSIGKL